MCKHVALYAQQEQLTQVSCCVILRSPISVFLRNVEEVLVF